MNVMLILLLSSLFGFGNPATADPGSEEENTPSVTSIIQIKKQIQDQIPFPKFSKELEGPHEVDVLFKITDDNLINLQKVASNDQEMNAYVQAQLETIQLQGNFSQLSPNITYKITLRFRRL